MFEKLFSKFKNSACGNSQKKTSREQLRKKANQLLETLAIDAELKKLSYCLIILLREGKITEDFMSDYVEPELIKNAKESAQSLAQGPMYTDHAKKNDVAEFSWPFFVHRLVSRKEAHNPLMQDLSNGHYEINFEKLISKLRELRDLYCETILSCLDTSEKYTVDEIISATEHAISKGHKRSKLSGQLFKAIATMHAANSETAPEGDIKGDIKEMNIDG